MDGAIQVIKELAAGGFVTFLLAILVAGKYGIWVWGTHYKDMIKEKDERFSVMVQEKDAIIAYERREKDEWKSYAWETRKLTEKSVNLATKAVAP